MSSEPFKQEATSVSVRVDGSIRRITLNRPDKANAFSLALAEELLEAARDAHDDPECKVVVLSAGGRFFSAGGDVAEMSDAADPGAFVHRLAGVMHEAILEFASSSAIIVAAVHAPAAGGGVGLAWNADLTVCAESARFIPAYLAAGLAPDCGTSYALCRSAGSQRAANFFLGGAPMAASIAAQLGLVARVVPDDDFTAELEALVTSLADAPAAALAATKKLIAADLDALSAHLDAERSAIARTAATPEAIARMRALTSR